MYMVMSTHTVYSIIILEVFVMYFSQLPTYVECTVVAMQLYLLTCTCTLNFMFSHNTVLGCDVTSKNHVYPIISLNKINCLTSLIKWVSWIGSLVTFSFGTVASSVMNTLLWLYGMFLAEACKIVQSYKATIVAWEGGSRTHSTHDTLYFL